MDMNKIFQWMDLAKKYQTNDFWKEVFEHPSFEQFMNSQESSGTESPFENGKNKCFPPIDIYLTDQEVLLIAELAGYSKEHIQLSISGIKLLIKGNNNTVFPGNPVQQERIIGPFQRVIELPEPTLPNQIRATFKDGLLFISYKRQFIQEEEVPIE
ncbi:Hsp20/alpha crystallin family protein [Niallia oryzisoli]|uniref:Hsp20/alpha crystallin family protein n=1 Tax=Niallia oryzisoli TaxID=1737571 RepID=A0ABZ2CAI3_9BACI